MKIICISDTHGRHNYIKNLPEGDVLIHAGDITAHGTASQLIEFYGWLTQLNYKHIILIAGNHDKYCQKEDIETKKIFKHERIFYLNESGCEIEGIKFWGSPWSPFFFNWSFNIPPGKEEECWDKIPNDVDVLITHGPPFGILDLSKFQNEHCGCKELKKKVDLIKPKVHIFGHIHEAYGIEKIDNVIYVNASTCNFKYIPENLPIVIEI